MSVPHMDPEEFRRLGHELVDWIADYHRHVEQFPVRSEVEPGWVRRQLPPSPPVTGEPLSGLVDDLDRVIVPGLTHWQHPSFFGFFPANASFPSILGELVSAGLGVQGMLWSTSPAVTELESHVLDWLVELCGLPDRFRSDGPGGGVIQGSASEATLCAVLAARARAGGDDRHRELVGYVSEQAHSSADKAFAIAGLRPDQLRHVRVDDSYALDPVSLGELVAKDRADGLLPFFAMATVGTTSTTAIDPVPAVAEVCQREDLWLHVDAAFAGAAAVCPELRWVNAGLDRVDSYLFNPHKWLLVNFDCDAFYVADRRPLLDALSILPEYLRDAASESGSVVDYRDWQVPLGRRFRALKLWLTLRHYGAEGLAAHVRGHVAAAQWFAAQVVAEPRFEVAAPHPLSLVCFRLSAGDEANQRLLARLNDSGRLYLTHTRLEGHLVLRLAVGGTYTEHRHVVAAWERIRSTADEVLEETR
jgi:aromatic-L-amino-acid/L-tryptophan decarboxylase